MITIIRIRGLVGLDRDVKETFNRLNLNKKYSCTVFVNPTKEQLGMIKKLRNFIAFGEITKDVFEKLIETRAQLIDKTKKIEAKKIIEGLEKGKRYNELNLKPFFRLHPPRKGIESKKHFGVGKGVLGDHEKEINKLLERML